LIRTLRLQHEEFGGQPVGFASMPLTNASRSNSIKTPTATGRLVGAAVLAAIDAADERAVGNWQSVIPGESFDSSLGPVDIAGAGGECALRAAKRRIPLAPAAPTQGGVKADRRARRSRARSPAGMRATASPRVGSDRARFPMTSGR
jgi:hypothetical protein